MCKDWCHEECVGIEKWVQCDMSVDWCLARMCRDRKMGAVQHVCGLTGAVKNV
jgi:hypothetical protein